MTIQEFVKEVYDALGPGYSERVYHNAMEVILRENGIPYESERIVPIVFRGHTIGNLRADIIIDRTTVLELKSVKTMNEAMISQAKNYLKLLGLEEAYLINFPTGMHTEPEIVHVNNNVSPLQCTTNQNVKLE
jgi:GxxExxY protein